MYHFILPFILQKTIWLPTRLFFLFFGNIRIIGLENLKKLKSNVIFACNHSSELDPILVPASLPFFTRFSPMFYTSRESKFYSNSGWRKHFYGGWFFKIWGSYPVFTGLRDYEKSLRNHIRIVNSGGNLCVFPEGGITPDGTMQPAKGGVSFLSYFTMTPVIPVYIGGVYKSSFVNFILRRVNIVIIFGEPIYQEFLLKNEPTVDDYKLHAKNIMQKILILSRNEEKPHTL